MRITIPRPASVLFFLSIALVLSSCSESNPGNPGGNVNAGGGTGSTFTMAWYNTDGQGNPVPFSHDTVVTTLAAIESYEGKSNVHRFDNRYGSGYVAYRADGDLLTYFPLRTISGNGLTYYMPAFWAVFPAGTRQPVTMQIWDTTVTSGPASVHDTYTYRAEHIGTSTVSVGSKTFTAQVIEYSLDYASLAMSGNDTLFYVVNSIRNRVEYVPEIGTTVRESVGSSFSIDGDNRPINGQRRELIAYELK